MKAESNSTAVGLSPQPKAVSVGEVVLRIKDSLSAEFPSKFWVEGQVSNCTYHSSGHIYFSLVDEQLTDRFGQPLLISCAFFKRANQGLKFKLTDGLKLLCLGQVATYEARSQYQLMVFGAQPKGKGALQLAFEQLKKRLAAEGLFDKARKRPIPLLPSRVAVVTSPTGSAVHDMVSKLRDWFHVVVLPVKVQGEGSAEAIEQALRLANKHRLAEVLILGRGGGSVEDLWSFNEERVARAIALSEIPVISAVGHEDDWTIADFVADLRASTPTDAAKHLVQEKESLSETLKRLAQRLAQSMDWAIQDQAEKLRQLAHRLHLLHPTKQLDATWQEASQWNTRLGQAMRHALEQEESRLTGVIGRLEALSPLAVLSRGYSITFFGSPKRILKNASDVSVGDKLETRLDKGSIHSKVINSF